MEQWGREDQVRQAKDEEQKETKKLQEIVQNAQEMRDFQQNSRDITQGNREQAKDEEQDKTAMKQCKAGWTLRMNARYQEEVNSKQETIQIENAVRGCQLDRQQMAIDDKKWQPRREQEVGKARGEEPGDCWQSQYTLKLLLALNVIIMLMILLK